jgi:adenylate kinase
VPDEVVIGMIDNQLKANPEAKGFIFDGFPRTVPQAEALDKLLANNGTGISLMLALEVDEEVLTSRLIARGATSGRPDDRDETLIRKRVNEYNTKTAPVATYYKNQGKYQSVNGIGEIQEIFMHLCTHIESVQV